MVSIGGLGGNERVPDGPMPLRSWFLVWPLSHAVLALAMNNAINSIRILNFGVKCMQETRRRQRSLSKPLREPQRPLWQPDEVADKDVLAARH